MTNENELSRLRTKVLNLEIENKRLKRQLEAKAEKCAVCVVRHHCPDRKDRG